MIITSLMQPFHMEFVQQNVIENIDIIYPSYCKEAGEKRQDLGSLQIYRVNNTKNIGVKVYVIRKIRNDFSKMIME